MTNNHKKDIPQQLGIIDEMLKRGDEVIVKLDGNQFIGIITFAPLKAGDVWQVKTNVPTGNGEETKLAVLGINPYSYGFAYMLKFVEE